ncbi:MAG: hypothetical protein D6820_15550, partial [Lentisphaerae bacterium]
MSFEVLFLPVWYNPRIHEGVAEFARDHDWHLNCDFAFDHRLPRSWRADGILSLLTPACDFLDQFRGYDGVW